MKGLIHNDFKDKPTLPQYLTDLIEVNKLYNRTVVITFHQQTFNEFLERILLPQAREGRSPAVGGR
ncbi:hypothetical protein MKY70_08715 [Bacillus sp. FSL R9-9492]|uniref:hypothetical protein n=1 Tax=Bacillus sp. FSL R9-9492 TaxID=2921592 RepID=UPI0030F698E7